MKFRSRVKLKKALSNSKILSPYDLVACLGICLVLQECFNSILVALLDVAGSLLFHMGRKDPWWVRSAWYRTCQLPVPHVWREWCGNGSAGSDRKCLSPCIFCKYPYSWLWSSVPPPLLYRLQVELPEGRANAGEYYKGMLASSLSHGSLPLSQTSKCYLLHTFAWELQGRCQPLWPAYILYGSVGLDL